MLLEGRRMEIEHGNPLPLYPMVCPIPFSCPNVSSPTRNCPWEISYPILDQPPFIILRPALPTKEDDNWNDLPFLPVPHSTIGNFPDVLLTAMRFVTWLLTPRFHLIPQVVCGCTVPGLGQYQHQVFTRAASMFPWEMVRCILFPTQFTVVI